MAKQTLSVSDIVRTVWLSKINANFTELYDSLNDTAFLDQSNTFTFWQTIESSSWDALELDGIWTNATLARFRDSWTETGLIWNLNGSTDFFIRWKVDLYLTAGWTLTQGIVVKDWGVVNLTDTPTSTTGLVSWDVYRSSTDLRTIV